MLIRARPSFFELGIFARAYIPQISLLVGTNLVNINTAIALLETTSEDASVGVIAAGVLPYFFGRRAVDFLEKMDK